jgi:ArsR family transcriptional regulator
MNKETYEKFRIRADVIKAMAHPTRLFIMNKVAEKRYCVNELQELIGSDLSTVSKHLTVLRKAGILIDSKEGTQVFYSLKVPCIMNFMNCVETLIKENAVQNLCNL